MAQLKKMVKTGKSLVNRIAGISIMGVGLSWKAAESERAIVRDVLIQLEDRRALYTNEEREGAAHVVSSILEVREILTKGLQRVGDDSPARAPFRMMRAACRAFLSSSPATDRPRFEDREEAAAFYAELGKLRGIVGQQLAVLCVQYDIELEPELQSILPPDPDEDDTKKKPARK